MASKNINAEKIQGNLSINGITGTTINVNGQYELPTTLGTSGDVLTLDGTNQTVWQAPTGGGSGEANTASNIGGGEGLFSGKSGVDLQFKSLTSTGGTVTISSTGSTVNLESSGGGGGGAFTNDADHNLFGGTNAGVNLSGSDQRNFFAGYYAGNQVTSGKYNIGIGQKAMGSAATTGDANIGIGYNAGQNITTGINNVAIGRQAGGNMSTSQYNTLVGFNAGGSTLGNRNVCMGYYVGGNNTGNYNTLIGESGSAISFGDKNVMLGHIASDLGNGNIAIGYRVQNGGDVTGNGNIFIHPSYAGGAFTYNAVSGDYNCVIGLDIEVPTGLSDYVSLYDLYRGDHSAGECFISCPPTPAADADLNNSEIHFSLDKTTSELKIKVRHSDGTYQTATVALT